MPELWHELVACHEFRLTYRQWLAEPAEHRALLLQFLAYKAQMEAIEMQESREKASRNRR